MFIKKKSYDDVAALIVNASATPRGSQATGYEKLKRISVFKTY